MARKVITCFLGDTYPTPRPNSLYRRISEGEPFETEVWSLLSLTQRFLAGAMVLPWTVTRSLRGSDLWDGKEGLLTEVPDHVTDGQPVVLARALRPDITIVHGAAADRFGNIVMVPPLGEGIWSAFAATSGVIARRRGEVRGCSPGEGRQSKTGRDFREGRLVIRSVVFDVVERIEEQDLSGRSVRLGRTSGCRVLGGGRREPDLPCGSCSGVGACGRQDRDVGGVGVSKPDPGSSPG